MFSPNRALRPVAVLAALTAFSLAPQALGEEPVHASTPAPGATVTFGGEPLFILHARIGSFHPEDRARALAGRLEKLARDDRTPVDAITVTETEGATDIVAGEWLLLTITDADAAAAGTPRAQLAGEWAKTIRSAIDAYRQQHSTRGTLLSLLYTVLASAALVLVLSLVQRGFRRLSATVDSWRTTRIKPLRIQKLEVVSADRVGRVFLLAVRAGQLALWLVIVLVYASLVFSFFPATRSFVDSATQQVLAALLTVGRGILGYLPSLVFVIVLAAVAWVTMKFARLVFNAIAAGSVVIPGFYPDWAQPTYKIVRFVIIVVAAVAMFPYIPGSSSTAFRAISIFVAALVSLGSSSAISNVIAGVVLTYTRAFQLGDRVQIADTMGDVVARTLLVTRIRTIKNVEVTIPNSQVLNSHVSNFTSRARHSGLILHTTVTIGYDAPWRKVHELLVEAARATPGILAEPAPFVLQTSLDDSYVSYQINATTDQPSRMVEIYSSLHQNIQDAFNKAGVEILSPQYGALRDGNRVTIPGEYLPQDYRAPSFRLEDAGDPKASRSEKLEP
jgi:small-conductance mechanosensitive channel